MASASVMAKLCRPHLLRQPESAWRDLDLADEALLGGGGGVERLTP